MRTAWENVKHYVEKKTQLEYEKNIDGYKNNYDEWSDVKIKLESIENHDKEIREIEESFRKQLRERDNILCKYGLMHELIK